MIRTRFPYQVDDISGLARHLHQGLCASDGVPGHLALLTLLVRGAGFRNFQHFRASMLAADRMATPPPVADMARVEQVLRVFDTAGRMTRWPGKTWQQHLALWALWARLPGGQAFTERQISAHLNSWHSFGDAAILRRTLAELGLVTRSIDGRDYRRVEQKPSPEAAALIRQLQPRLSA